jgi:hypothetical protein
MQPQRPEGIKEKCAAFFLPCLPSGRFVPLRLCGKRFCSEAEKKSFVILKNLNFYL